MTGGAGSDYFYFANRLETQRGANHDVITDFTHGTDAIDLYDIDARTGHGNQAFKFIGRQGFHHNAGELHYVYSGANTVIEGDVNGDGRADFQIELSGHMALNRFDFVL